jgi:hypothetical protein
VDATAFLRSATLGLILTAVVAAYLWYVFYWRGGALHDEGLYREGRLRP